MPGLDSLKTKLVENTQAQCDAIIAEARAQARKHSEESISAAQTEADAIISEANENAAAINKRADSTVMMNFRRASLSSKVESVERVIDAAVRELESIRPELFFEIAANLICSEPPAPGSVMLMQQSDLDVMPKTYVQSLNERLGAELITEAAAAALPSRGVVLRCGDIDVDLRFSELADEKSDELKSVAAKVLFG